MPNPRGETQYFSRFFGPGGIEVTCGWLRSGRQERSPCSWRPRASLKVDHSRAREPVYDFYEVYECGSDLLFKVRERPHRRRQIRPPRRAATGERGFSAACHPSVTGFNFYRCPFQDVRLNTFWASSEKWGLPWGWAAFGPPRGVPLFSARPRHARLESGSQPVLLLRYWASSETPCSACLSVERERNRWLSSGHMVGNNAGESNENLRVWSTDVACLAATSEGWMS